MAEYIGYRCKQCGYKVVAPPKGFGLTMMAARIFFKCNNCKEIVDYSTIELGESGR